MKSDTCTSLTYTVLTVKKWICTECIIDIYGGAFSVSYISSNSGSPFCSQHFRMNDLYRIVVNAGGKDSMNLK